MPFFNAAAGNALTTTLVGSSARTFFGGASGSNGFRIKSPFFRPAFARGSKRPTPAMLTFVAVGEGALELLRHRDEHLADVGLGVLAVKPSGDVLDELRCRQWLCCHLLSLLRSYLGPELVVALTDDAAA